MNILILFKNKELPILPSVNNDTEIPPTAAEEKRIQYAQVSFPDGIVIAEETVLVLPQMIDEENRYPALLYDCKELLPLTVIGSPEPIAGNSMDFEEKLIKKAAQYDIRIAAVLNDELPNIDENGKRILDMDWNESVRLFIRPIVGTEEYKRQRNQDKLPKLYYISNEDIKRQIATSEG